MKILLLVLVLAASACGVQRGYPTETCGGNGSVFLAGEDSAGKPDTMRVCLEKRNDSSM